MSRLIFLLFVTMFFLGCRPERGALQFSDSSSITGPGGQGSFEGEITPGMAVFKASVYQITSHRCVQCHGQIQKPLHASPNLQTAYEAAKSRVNFSNPAGSTIVLKSTDVHCGIPAICKTDGSAMLAAVTEWAKAENSPPPPPTGSGFLMETASTRLRLGNRLFIASRLDQIFGASQALTIDNIVRAQPTYFGGPCDKHNGDFVNGGNDYISGDCPEKSNSQSALVPFPNSGRFAYMSRVCDLAAQTDAAVIYAVNRAVGSNATTRALADADVASLHKMFYLKDPDSEVTSALMNLASNAGNDLEGWRFVLFTLCSDPGWQIP